MYKIIITYSEKYGAICECWYNDEPVKSFILTESSDSKIENTNEHKCLSFDTFYPFLQSIHDKKNFNALFTDGLEIEMKDLPKEIRIKKQSDIVIIKFRRFNIKKTNELLKVTNIKSNTIPIGVAITSILLIGTIALSCIGNKKENDAPSISNLPISTSDTVDDILSNPVELDFFADQNHSTTLIDLSYLLDRETDNYPEYIRSVLNQVENGQTCEQIIEKYSKQFGIDKRLIIAIACQESRDGHNPNKSGSAIGQMQIEKAVWIGKTITVTDAKGNTISEYITEEKLQKLDFNIKIGCMIFQNYQRETGYCNIPLTFACYNMGPGTMRELTGEKKLQNIDLHDLGWIETMKTANCGDPEYIKHIMEWLTHLGLDEPYALITNNGETIHISFGLEKEKIPTIG